MSPFSLTARQAQLPTNATGPVREAVASDLPAIVRIHQLAFSQFFLTRLGNGFLHKYYGLVLEYRAGIILVGEDRGMPEGFVCGFVDPAEFYRLMARNRRIFVPPVLAALLRRPTLAAKVLNGVQRIQTLASESCARSCELSSIAVAPEAGGAGLGMALMQSFLARAWAMDAQRVYLTTDADGNESANAFYKRAGFEQTRRFLQRKGRWMNEYVANPEGVRMKPSLERVFDVLCSAGGLLVLLPVFVLLALVILLTDGRPVFFRQTRVGRDGNPFRIWKFRTMRSGSTGSAVTAAGDSRITPVGRPLRRYKLDELPQLFNVLHGEMSLVGPRPEVPEYVQLAAPRWQAVLRVRPGITDLASLLYRDEEKILGASFNSNAFYRDTVLPQKLLLNLLYLRSRSFSRDLKLIFLSIRYSLFPKAFNAERIQGMLKVPLASPQLYSSLLPQSGAFSGRQGAVAQGARDE